MIEVLLAQNECLLRAALSALLAREDDISVVAELSDGQQLGAAVRHVKPDVVLVSAGLSGCEPGEMLNTLEEADPRSRVLLLVGARETAPLGRLLTRRAPMTGFVATEAMPATLLAALRRMAAGERFLDPALALAALNARDNPLTRREIEILRVAAEGIPVKDIANRLFLAGGTVRNYLSRIMAKTEARNRLEAVRIAEDAGWL